MARIEPLKDSQESHVTRLLDQQAKVWGQPLAPFEIYAHCPAVFRGVAGMWVGLDQSGLIAADLGALLNLRIAQLNHCVF
ncbi:MAG: hypothetical protein CMJ77_16305 [Planctomycetaceae bacterium]|nr:hypothetical protein [Planctomycetaceae bacterium]